MAPELAVRPPPSSGNRKVTRESRVQGEAWRDAGWQSRRTPPALPRGRARRRAFGRAPASCLLARAGWGYGRVVAGQAGRRH
eukprot:62958-Chlamydomonas_euryale.AAC.11